MLKIGDRVKPRPRITLVSGGKIGTIVGVLEGGLRHMRGQAYTVEWDGIEEPEAGLGDWLLVPA